MDAEQLAKELNERARANLVAKDRWGITQEDVDRELRNVLDGLFMKPVE